jgi:APA family basic amino acid/polyamine antiporter
MANEKRKLRKALGVFDVTAIVSGIIIGAGVFAITGLATKYAGALT